MAPLVGHAGLLAALRCIGEAWGVSQPLCSRARGSQDGPSACGNCGAARPWAPGSAAWEREHALLPLLPIKLMLGLAQPGASAGQLAACKQLEPSPTAPEASTPPPPGFTSRTSTGVNHPKAHSTVRGSAPHLLGLDLAQDHVVVGPEQPHGGALDVAVPKGGHVGQQAHEPEAGGAEHVLGHPVLRRVGHAEPALHQGEDDLEGVHQPVGQQHEDDEQLGPVARHQAHLRQLAFLFSGLGGVLGQLEAARHLCGLHGGA